MTKAPRPDPTNAERQRRHRGRRRAVRNAMADPAEREAAEAAPVERVQNLTSQAAAVRRLEDAAARQKFVATIEANAEAIANKLLERALDGDVGALLAVASRLAPPARPERRVRIENLPSLTSPEACLDAGRLIGEAAARGEVGLDDAIGLQRLIAGVAEAQANAAREAALVRMNARLENGGGLRMRLRELVVDANTSGTMIDVEAER